MHVHLSGHHACSLQITQVKRDVGKKFHLTTYDFGRNNNVEGAVSHRKKLADFF